MKNKRKKETFLKKTYKDSWQHIKETKNYALFSFGLLCLIFLIGFAYPLLFENQIIDLLQDLTSKIEDKSITQTILFILGNNVRTSFFVIIFGVAFAILPIFGIITNGYVLGFVANKAVAVEGLGVLWRLLPHGIFEIPAVILALAFGIRIGFSSFSLVEKFMKKHKKNLSLFIHLILFLLFPLVYLLVAYIVEINSKEVKKINSLFWLSIKAFIFVVLPLLIIAAIIEGILIGLGV